MLDMSENIHSFPNCLRLSQKDMLNREGLTSH